MGSWLQSYQTAWVMLHRLRVTMVRPGRERLSGRVEVEESYVGGNEAGATGRETETKSRVAIAVEFDEPMGIGRIRLEHVPDVSGASLMAFVQASVEPRSSVRTDGWQAYWTLPDHGYTHDRVVIRRGKVPAHVAMPNVHLVASLLKRWLLGTRQGAVHATHLQAYLNEFTFRFSRRRSRARGLRFYRLLEQAAVAEPVTYPQLLVAPGAKRRRYAAPPGTRSNRHPSPYRRPSDPGATKPDLDGYPTFVESESAGGSREGRRVSSASVDANDVERDRGCDCDAAILCLSSGCEVCRDRVAAAVPPAEERRFR
jgi:transposase-like protein